MYEQHDSHQRLPPKRQSWISFPYYAAHHLAVEVSRAACSTQKSKTLAHAAPFNFHDLATFSATSSSVALIAAFEHPSCCELKSSIVPTLLRSGFAITITFNFSCSSAVSVAGAFFDAAAAAADAVSAWNASAGAGGGAMALPDVGAACLAVGAGAVAAVVDGAGSQ